MGRDRVFPRFARALTVFGAAAAIAIGLAGSAGAAPADRGGDPVVLEGSELSGLAGVAPGRIVAFRWNRGWRQVPVQVDQRHTIDVRQLYPPGTHPPYVGNDDPDFDLEVYADPKTRSGADQNRRFDADDELVFMGRDAGRVAPAKARPPAGVAGRSAVRVAVADPVGGGFAALYLFRKTRGLDPGAGRDYVDYDFRLTSLTAGQTLRNDYGYFSEFNPEDSTVKTRSYELHSYDRWMEDELKVKAGNASQEDILDREVAQATLSSCGRTEYTFSGRWTQDNFPGNDAATDNEGTYIAVIDGPVRAIRSYMGANSGPYVQRRHVYYADHEQNTIFLRVHPMLDLYAWTDYAPSAIGMTYRDAKNLGGVPVDGSPDTLVPTTTADVADGTYSWQQLSGPQGAVSTVVGVETDLPNPNFGNYYVDDSTPTGVGEFQCGGDGHSIGASGFGILGPVTPNTDPRLGDFNNLTVKRIRYFGPPSDGAAEGGEYAKRVEQPLAARAKPNPLSGRPVLPPRARLRVALPRRKAKARRGKVYRVRIRVANLGNRAARTVRVCVRGAKLRRRGACRTLRALGARKARRLVIRVRVRPRAKGRRLGLRVTARSRNGKARAGERRVVALRG